MNYPLGPSCFREPVLQRPIILRLTTPILACLAVLWAGAGNALHGQSAESDLADILTSWSQGNQPALTRGEAEAVYRDVVETISQQVVKTRELPLKHAVETRLMSDPEVVGWVETQREKLIGDEDEALADGLASKALGVIPEDTDVLLLMRMRTVPPIAGFYDPESKFLSVLTKTDPLSPFGQQVLAHEITHALQDQHFDLNAMVYETDGLNADTKLARRAVVEGDAELSENEWQEAFGRSMAMAGGGRSALAESSLPADMWLAPEFRTFKASAPPSMGVTSYFPYSAGLEFMAHLKQENFPFWRMLPFRVPPQSTEQILHPEKYYPRMEAPRPVSAPSWPEGRHGLTERYRDTWGEWGIRLTLSLPGEVNQALLPEAMRGNSAAFRGAAGWGGDEMMLAHDEKREAWVLAWATVWDSEDDAAEFLEMLERRFRSLSAFEKLWSAGRPMPADGETAVWSGEGRTLRLRRAGDAVDVWMATDPVYFDALEQ
ncbi:MAG: hypothetical protein RLY93_17690 [Sumerlaeia bacterium]